MIVVLVFLFVFVAKHNVFIAFVDVGFEYFIRALRESCPSVTLIFKIMISDIRVSVGYANIESFVF